MMLAPLAIDIGSLFAVAFLLMSFIGWIVNLINAQNPPPGPKGRPPGVRARSPATARFRTRSSSFSGKRWGSVLPRGSLPRPRLPNAPRPVDVRSHPNGSLRPRHPPPRSPSLRAPRPPVNVRARGSRSGRRWPVVAWGATCYRMCRSTWRSGWMTRWDGICPIPSIRTCPTTWVPSARKTAIRALVFDHRIHWHRGCCASCAVPRACGGRSSFGKSSRPPRPFAGSDCRRSSAHHGRRLSQGAIAGRTLRGPREFGANPATGRTAPCPGLRSADRVSGCHEDRSGAPQADPHHGHAAARYAAAASGLQAAVVARTGVRSSGCDSHPVATDGTAGSVARASARAAVRGHGPRLSRCARSARPRVPLGAARHCGQQFGTAGTDAADRTRQRTGDRHPQRGAYRHRRPGGVGARYRSCSDDRHRRSARGGQRAHRLSAGGPTGARRPAGCAVSDRGGRARRAQAAPADRGT